MARARTFISGLILVAVIVLVVATDLVDWIGLGGGGDSKGGSNAVEKPAGGETAPAETEPAPAPLRKRPLEIVIRDHDYIVAGNKQTLDEVLARARKVPEGAGPAVIVTRAPSSRAGAEESLRRLFVEQDIDFEWRD